MYKRQPYILAVSSIDPRKNFISLIEAFTRSNVHCNLVIIGKKHKSFKQFEIEAESDKIKFLGYIPDAELISYYRNAIAFVSVSLYEGDVYKRQPAKVIAKGIRRIYNYKAEAEINDYFKHNPDCKYLQLDLPQESLEKYCIDNALHF